MQTKHLRSRWKKHTKLALVKEARGAPRSSTRLGRFAEAAAAQSAEERSAGAILQEAHDLAEATTAVDMVDAAGAA